MIKLSLTRLAVAVGGLALSLTAGAGVASADPDLGPIVNTTCSYPQVMAALQRARSGSRRAIQRFADVSSPICVSSSPRRRVNASRSPSRLRARQGLSSSSGLVQQVFNTCNNY